MTHRIFGVWGLAAAALFMPGTSAANDWYLAFGGSATLLQDSDSTLTDAVGNSIDFTTEFDAGFGITGAMGYSWNQVRLEGEVSYRQNDIDSIELTSITLAGIGSFTTAAAFEGDGDVSALGFMVNGWYDFNTGSRWTPYLGIGVGTAQISINDASVTILGVDVPLADDDDWVFAYQAGAGITYEISPNVDISLGYRFFGTSDPDFTDVSGIPFDVEYMSHNIEVGVRIGI